MARQTQRIVFVFRPLSLFALSCSLSLSLSLAHTLSRDCDVHSLPLDGDFSSAPSYPTTSPPPLAPGLLVDHGLFALAVISVA